MSPARTTYTIYFHSSFAFSKMSRVYTQAGGIVNDVMNRRGSVKNLTLSTRVRNKPQMFALVSETLRFRGVLEEIMKRSGVSKKQWDTAVRCRGVLLVMMYDFLLGQGVRGGGAVKRMLRKHESALRVALNSLRKEKNLVTDNKHENPTDNTHDDPAVEKKNEQSRQRKLNELLLPIHLRRTSRPELLRFARVNSLQCTVEIAIKSLRENGGHKAIEDTVIPGLLMLPANTDLHDHPLVLTGKLILQDKASCFPAFILLGQIGATLDLQNEPSTVCDIIDCCAAPGNKTSHAAAQISSGFGICIGKSDIPSTTPSRVYSEASKIFAFDKSEKRLALLERRMLEAGANNVVKPHLADFLQIDPKDEKYQNVRAILLDPSCSGTGMPQHHIIDGYSNTTPTSSRRRSANTYYNDVTGTTTMLGVYKSPDISNIQRRNVHISEQLRNRAAKLSSFQLSAIKHAFTFPHARRLTYSTCSVLATENEAVVAAALEWSVSQGVIGGAGAGWELSTALPGWHRRGWRGEGLSPSDAAKVVRVDPSEDKMNGFFVSLFVRRCEGRDLCDAEKKGETDAKICEEAGHQKELANQPQINREAKKQSQIKMETCTQITDEEKTSVVPLPPKKRKIIDTVMSFSSRKKQQNKLEDNKSKKKQKKKRKKKRKVPVPGQ